MVLNMQHKSVQNVSVAEVEAVFFRLALITLMLRTKPYAFVAERLCAVFRPVVDVQADYSCSRGAFTEESN